jgi:hypothetical protein
MYIHPRAAKATAQLSKQSENTTQTRHRSKSVHDASLRVSEKDILNVKTSNIQLHFSKPLPPLPAVHDNEVQFSSTLPELDPYEIQSNRTSNTATRINEAFALMSEPDANVLNFPLAEATANANAAENSGGSLPGTSQATGVDVQNVANGLPVYTTPLAHESSTASSMCSTPSPVAPLLWCKPETILHETSQFRMLTEEMKISVAHSSMPPLERHSAFYPRWITANATASQWA